MYIVYMYLYISIFVFVFIKYSESNYLILLGNLLYTHILCVSLSTCF